jgi:hypothetical protein
MDECSEDRIIAVHRQHFEHINNPANWMNQHSERRGEIPPSPPRNEERRNEIAA